MISGSSKKKTKKKKVFDIFEGEGVKRPFRGREEAGHAPKGVILGTPIPSSRFEINFYWVDFFFRVKKN